MIRHRVATRAIPAILLPSLLLLASCASTKIAGRVVDGPAGVPVVVPASDPRIAAARPVPAIKVEVIGESGAIVASAVSGENGNFTLSMPSAGAPTRPVELRAQGPGIFTASGTLYLPRDGSWILFNVKPDPAASTTR